MEAILEAVTSQYKTLDKRVREREYLLPKNQIVWNLPVNSYTLGNSFQTLLYSNNVKSLLSKNIDKIKALEHDWDGNGAIAPLTPIINKTEIFLRSLPTYITDLLNENSIYPNPNGTITVEWEKNNNLVSVELGLKTSNYFARINSEYVGEESIVDIETVIPSKLIQSIQKVIA